MEQKRIEDIVGLATLAPVVAGARLGENADSSPGAVRGLIEDGPAGWQGLMVRTATRAR
jgi:hypothetical protein